MKATLLSAVLILLCTSANAQSYAKVYRSQDYLTPQAITHDESNGVLVVGKRWEDAFALRLDENGEIIWQKSWANPINLYPRFNFDQVIPVADSCFVLVGSMSNESSMSLTSLVMKLDKDGNLLWKKSFENEPLHSIYHATAIETSDSGYLLGWGSLEDGSAYSLVKIDQNGNELWSRAHTTTTPSFLSDIEKLNDTTYLLAGNIDLPGINAPYYAGFLNAVDENGDLLWSKKYEGLYIDDIEIRNGNLAVIGKNANDNFQYFYSFGDLNGNLLWNRSPDFGFSSNLINYFSQVISLTDSTHMVYLGSPEWSGKAFKIDASGTVVHTMELDPIMTDLMRTNENGVLFLGKGPLYGIKSLYEDHIGTVRVDSTLAIPNCGWQYNSLQTELFMPPADTMVWGLGQTPNSIDQAIFSEPIDMLASYSCVDFFSETTTIEAELDLQIYPSISDGNFTIETSHKGLSLTITAANGQRVKSFASVNDKEQFSIGECANGLYYYKAMASDGHEKTGTLILNK